MNLRSSRLAAFFVGACALFVVAGGQAVAGLDAEPTELRSAVTIGFVPNRSSGPADLDGQLDAVADVARQRGAAAAVRRARSQGLDVRGNRVRVVVEGGSGVAAAVQARGGSVEARSGALVEALVPPASLESLAVAPGVADVRTPFLARPMGTHNEAVAAMNAGRAHVVGNLGAGVKVAIIDGGFGDLAETQARGDLPANVTTVDYCGGSMGAPEVHGTAVAENVHDVAPGASLYLVCITTEVTLASAASYVKAQGVDIVVHSIGWFNTSRGDGTGGAGTPDALVADARANGILWINAAGNQAEQHWRGQYFDAEGTGFHNFASNDELNSFFVGGGQTACVAMKWDAWPTTSTQDYDLFIVRNSDGAMVSGSFGEQSPLGGMPTEETCFTNSGPTQAFGFAIDRFAGSGTPMIDVFVLDAGEIEIAVAAGSVVEPATSPAAVAVGAVCWSNLGLQPYSAQGPTIDGRTKPDLVAPDGTSSGVYGAAGNCATEGFVGTSGSAPHTAGLAALLKAATPSLTAAQLEASLLGEALDVGVKGIDSGYGAGLAWLPSATALAPNGGRISFARGSNSSRDLWTSDLDGGNAVNVTPGSPSDESFSFWSPDGSQIAYYNPWLNIADADGSDARRIDDTGVPAWSHDGSRIAIVESGRLKILPAAGGVAVDHGSLFWATSGVSWSLDDSKLYGVHGGDVVTVDADGSNRTPVAATAPSEESIALSPDGTKIAYAAQSGGVGSDMRIYVIDSTMTGTPVELTTDPTRDENWPRWSPDGTTILYTSYLPDCCTKAETWRVGATGTPAPQVVTTVTVSEWFPDWQPLVAPTARELPFVQGSPVAGSTLTALTNYGGSAPVTISYNWQKCNASSGACALTGVTSPTYQLTAADIGHTFAVSVEASNDAGNSSLLSSSTPVVVVAPAPSPPPPSGGGGGGGGGAGPDIEVSLTASNSTPAANGVVEVRATVFNRSMTAAGRGLRAEIVLPVGVTLLGPPAVDTGSGCTGTGTLDCNLDYLSPNSPTKVLFAINVGPAGTKSITVRATMTVTDPNLANNTGALALEVRGATPAPTAPAQTGGTAGKTFNGTAAANVLRGTPRADTLRGLGGNDRLYGFGGNDRLFGGAGNDRLEGGTGRDLLDGGAGNDLVAARDKAVDTIRCGAGRDVVVADRIDKVARDCETVRRK